MEPDEDKTTDAALVARAVKGDSAAFETLVRRHYRAAFATALALVGNSMDAEDVCQDAFVRALERLEDCHSPNRFKAWFLRIVRNRAHNFRDYQRVRAGADVDDLPLAGRSNPARDAAQAELREQMERALAALTEVQRSVVLLHDMEGLKHQEIADTLDMSVESSRQHLFVARKRLRKLLGTDTVKVYLHE